MCVHVCVWWGDRSSSLTGSLHLCKNVLWELGLPPLVSSLHMQSDRKKRKLSDTVQSHHSKRNSCLMGLLFSHKLGSQLDKQAHMEPITKNAYNCHLRKKMLFCSQTKSFLKPPWHLCLANVQQPAFEANQFAYYFENLFICCGRLCHP